MRIMPNTILAIFLTATTAVTGVQAQTPDYEAACRLTPACMALLASLGASTDPAPAAVPSAAADAVPYEPAYTDAEIAGARSTSAGTTTSTASCTRATPTSAGSGTS